jgi:hypothetical protein
MGGTLEKSKPPSPPSGPPDRRKRLPDRRRASPPTLFSFDSFPEGDKIPNASLIYGIGSAVLFAYSLFFLIAGPRLTGLLLWLPAGGLLGFALHFLKHDKD